jgi:predicted nucleic acid-binding protein
MILLDTNILIHGNQETSPHYTTITQRLIEFADNNEELAICPQVLYEFYVTATRPSDSRGGLGMSNDEALEQIQKFQSIYNFINDPDNLFTTWTQLMINYGAMGTSGHDARLVAFMQVHAIEHIYTMNPKHFNRYADIITVLN